MSRKIMIKVNLNESQLSRIRTAMPGWEVILAKDESMVSSHIHGAEVIVGFAGGLRSYIEADAALKLRWIHNWGAGIDELPLSRLKVRNVQLTNSSGVHAYPISETVLGMMLALTRKLHVYVRNQQAQTWHHAHLSMEMHGRTVGILGLGAIGSEVAKLCKAFGMYVIGLRRSKNLHPYVDELYDLERLDVLMAKSDYVVNCLPLTPETTGLISEDMLTCMKSTAFYINIGRGRTTDQHALIRLLEDGRIGGAGLDVFTEEPLPNGNPLWHMENVIVTPHSSGSTEHYDERALDIFMENVPAYLEHGVVRRNVVNLDAAY